MGYSVISSASTHVSKLLQFDFHTNVSLNAVLLCSHHSPDKTRYELINVDIIRHSH